MADLDALTASLGEGLVPAAPSRAAQASAPALQPVQACPSLPQPLPVVPACLAPLLALSPGQRVALVEPLVRDVCNARQLLVGLATPGSEGPSLAYLAGPWAQARPAQWAQLCATLARRKGLPGWVLGVSLAAVATGGAVMYAVKKG